MKLKLKTLIAALIVALSSMAFATLATRAEVVVDVTKGNVEPLPIAITDFLAGGDLGAKISGVVAADLKRSGLFAPIDQGAFIEKISNPDVSPRFEDWKVINAQALVTGRVTQEGDGRLRAEYRLWDTFAGQQLDGQQFYANPDNWRRIAHIIADAIYERLTGEKGYFDTRIVFVSEVRPEGQAHQKACHHGSGRRGRAHVDQRQGPCADAALFAEQAGSHLYVVRRRQAGDLSLAA